MKTKLQRLAAMLLCFSAIFFYSCSKKEVSTNAQISALKDQFSSSLTNVKVYSSRTAEGNDGYIDRTFIAALLSDDGKFPSEMELCDEYSFFCASSLNICEAWAVECRTYTSAREIEALFERRRTYLSKQDFDSESDIAAVASAKVYRQGKRVYFAAAQNSAELLRFLTDF